MHKTASDGSITKVSSIGQIELFKDFFDFIGPWAKKTFKKQHKKCTYESTMNAIP